MLNTKRLLYLKSIQILNNDNLITNNPSHENHTNCL